MLILALGTENQIRPCNLSANNQTDRNSISCDELNNSGPTRFNLVLHTDDTTEDNIRNEGRI